MASGRLTCSASAGATPGYPHTCPSHCTRLHCAAQGCRGPLATTSALPSPARPFASSAIDTSLPRRAPTPALPALPTPRYQALALDGLALAWPAQWPLHRCSSLLCPPGCVCDGYPIFLFKFHLSLSFWGRSQITSHDWGGGGGLLNVTSLCQMHGKVTLALAA